VRKDGQGARTHLQLASKNGPSLFERYAIFAGGEAVRRLKDGAEGGMDMAAYLEFQRNIRCAAGCWLAGWPGCCLLGSCGSTRRRRAPHTG
jgi:hypothetical protein